jgi:DNA-binding transcriptional MerR regulator
MNLLTTQQAARLLGITPRAMLSLATRHGVKPADIIGRNRMWRVEDVNTMKITRRGAARKIST